MKVVVAQVLSKATERGDPRWAPPAHGSQVVLRMVSGSSSFVGLRKVTSCVSQSTHVWSPPNEMLFSVTSTNVFRAKSKSGIIRSTHVWLLCEKSFRMVGALAPARAQAWIAGWPLSGVCGSPDALVTA